MAMWAVSPLSASGDFPSIVPTSTFSSSLRASISWTYCWLTRVDASQGRPSLSLPDPCRRSLPSREIDKTWGDDTWKSFGAGMAVSRAH